MKRNKIIIGIALVLSGIWGGAYFAHLSVAERAWMEVPVVLTAGIVAISGIALMASAVED